MINADTVLLNPLVILEHVQNHHGPFVLVPQVRCMHKNQFIGLHGQIDMFLKHRGLVGSVLVQANLPNAQNIGPFQKFWDQFDHISGKADILSLLSVDTEP